MYYNNFSNYGYEFQDLIESDNYRYYVFLHKSGSVLVMRENKSSGSIRFAIGKIKNESEYNSFINASNLEALSYKIRSELKI